MTAPWLLEHTCQRQFTVQWRDCQNLELCLSVLLLVVVTYMITYTRLSKSWIVPSSVIIGSVSYMITHTRLSKSWIVPLSVIIGSCYIHDCVHKFVKILNCAFQCYYWQLLHTWLHTQDYQNLESCLWVLLLVVVTYTIAYTSLSKSWIVHFSVIIGSCYIHDYIHKIVKILNRAFECYYW